MLTITTLTAFFFIRRRMNMVQKDVGDAARMISPKMRPNKSLKPNAYRGDFEPYFAHKGYD